MFAFYSHQDCKTGQTDQSTSQRLGCLNVILGDGQYDDSIDDSDGSVITTLTTASTLTEKQQTQQKKYKKINLQENYYKPHEKSYTNRLRRVASGLRLAQSQAMAVAGFLPETIELKSNFVDDFIVKKRIKTNTSKTDDREDANTDEDYKIINFLSGKSSGQLNHRASFHGRGQTSYKNLMLFSLCINKYFVLLLLSCMKF